MGDSGTVVSLLRVGKKCTTDKEFYSFLYLFIQLRHMGRITITAYANYREAALSNPSCQLPWRKPTTFGRAYTILISHNDWAQVTLRRPY